MIPAWISCTIDIVYALCNMCGFALHLLGDIFQEHLYTCQCYLWHILKLLNQMFF